MDDLSDVELVQRFKSGDDGAFDAIVRRFQDRVYRLACIWLHDQQHAADVAQEVFLRSYKGLRRFRFRAAPFTWLYRMTRNVCNEVNRRRRGDTLADEPADPAAQPEQFVAQLETIDRIRALIAVLPERQREVFMLRVFEELSVGETASAMGCREGTVKALMHKARKRLNVKLGIAGLEADG